MWRVRLLDSCRPNRVQQVNRQQRLHGRCGVETMNDGGRSSSLVAAIYEDCIFLVHNFSSILFVHCPRESNDVAHVLASKAEGDLSVIWQSDSPDFIVDVLANDVSLFESS